MKSSNSDIIWHHATVTRKRREMLNGHKGILVWLTGLSGAGKSTLAHMIEEIYHEKGYRTFVLDGDNVRHGLCEDLSFSADDRHENIRRIAHMAEQFVEAGFIVLTAFISPFHADRENARKILGNDFHEVYCKCSLEVCEQRDVKGLYKKARAGIINNYTGISSPYEEPISPNLTLITDNNIEENVNILLEYLQSYIDI